MTNTSTTAAVSEFLRELDPSEHAKFSIETYSDQPKEQKANITPTNGRWKDLSIDDVIKLIPELELINKQHSAIYVAVNEFNGYRAKKNLSHIRCAHADMDYATNEQLEELKVVCPPSLVVESSPGRFHYYWLLEDRLEPDFIDEIESINRGFLKFGADKAATDCSRLLRLPGFFNQKHQVNMQHVKLASCTGRRYSVEALMKSLGTDKQVAQSAQIFPKPVLSRKDGDVITRIATLVAESEPSLMVGSWEKHPGDPDWMVGYDSQSDADLALAGKIARIAISEGVIYEDMPMIVEEVFGASGLAKRDKWQFRQDYRARTIRKALSDITLSSPVKIQATDEPDVKKMYGDVLNGHKFAEFWRGRMIYVTTVDKWLKWTGA